MYALGSSPPPPEPEASIAASKFTPDTPAAIIPANGRSDQHTSTTPAPSRKRKRGQAASTAHAASPAPSDPGSTTGKDAADTLLAVRTDLYSRPILDIMKGPTFIPVPDGSEWCKTEAVAFNRLGYRYVPAGIRPQGSITPCRTIESNPTSFRISWEDRSHSLRVTRDGLGLGGAKGFRSARCNAPMREGKWYLEVKIELGGGDRALDSTQKEGSYVRLGWGRREASLNGPAGMDGYSYGYRDKTGEKVALSRPRPYGKPFKSGDVVGMYISLPPLRQPNKKDPHDPAHLHRERIPIDLKGQEVFEILEYPVAKEMVALLDHPTKAEKSASLPSSTTKKPATVAKQPDVPTKEKPKSSTAPAMRPLPALKGSRIAFFLNGECQGTAFEDIYDFLPLRQSDTHRKAKGRRAKEGVKEHRENPFDDGTLGYYPMVSVYNDAMARLNPGPNFDFPPPRDIDALLDRRPQPEFPEAVKMEPGLTLPEGRMDVDEQRNSPVSIGATWRPAIERYPEFMEEQWALDNLEEEEAKIEFEKQKALEEAGVLSGGAKGKGKKGAAAAKAAASRRKKPTAEDSSKVGTPAPDEGSLIAPTNKKAQQATARKKAKKAEQQLNDTTAPQATEASTPRSATETPAGTPPPPSISSTAAAAAAAHLHLHHHPLNRQDLSNRPSPSPLRQSTAYREIEVENEDASVDRDSLPAVSPPVQTQRSRAPPGSKEGRQRAAAAAAAAHASGISPPLASRPHHSPPSTGAQVGGLSPSARGRPAASLMSLASLTTESAGAFPVSSSSSKPKPAPAVPVPSPLAQHHVPKALEPVRPLAPGGDYDLDDELLAAAGAASESEPDRHPMEEEEDEDEDEFELTGRRAAGYRYPYADEEEQEEEEEGAASAPYYTDRDGEEGVTTDGDSLYPYDERRERDADMETDYDASRPHSPT